MKTAEILALAAVAAACLRAHGESGAVSAVRAEIRSNSVDRTTGCRYYKAWYVDRCGKEELAAILERNIAAHRRWMELEPSIPAPHADLGVAFAAAGRWEEAEKELSAAISAGDRLDAMRRAMVRWEMANCLWKKGDRDGAWKIVEELAAQKAPPRELYHPIDKAKFLAMMRSGGDGLLDTFTLPHSVDGKPFPAPQKAEYGDERVSLAKVELRVVPGGTGRTSGTGVAGLASPAGLSGLDDPIVRLLKRKLRRFGSKFEKGGTPVSIEISPDAPVDKPQGYSLDGAPGSVRIRARTRLGATWGVVSLLQCIDRGDSKPLSPELPKPSIRTLRIEDWPVCERRGVLDYWKPDFLEYALFNKMSIVTEHMDTDWSISPLDRERYRLFAAVMRDFGIEVHVNTRHLFEAPCIPLSSPRTWKLHVAMSRFLASIGMGNSAQMDDHRFPMPDADLEAYGAAAAIDGKYLTRLYLETKKDYPDFRMQFCPPFYWGPRGEASYPEPREPYLKSLAADLDPSIDVYWTGPYVKSQWMTGEYADWFGNLIGRKPTVFHNGNCIGQHYYIQFGADVSGYKASHAPDIFDHISAFQQNMSRYQETTTVGSAMDWCWNPAAHDPETAARRTVEQFEGPGVFEIIRDATPSLSYFDGYVYGEPRSELFAEDQSDLDRRVAEAEAAWRKVVAIARNGGEFVADFDRCGIRWAKRLADTLRNPPEALLARHRAAMANTEFAKEEVGFDAAKGDQFFPAELLLGGRFVRRFKSWSKGLRDVKYVEYGTSVSGRFACEPFPPERPFRLVVAGTAFTDETPLFEVSVNGRVIFKGEAFERYRFKPFEVEIPVDALRRSNTFEIRNASGDAGNTHKPIVHYVVIRK